MTKDIAEAVLDRIATWPSEALNDLFRLMGEIEVKYSLTYELTDEDREAVQRGLADAKAGRLVSHDEVEALFRRYFGPTES